MRKNALILAGVVAVLLVVSCALVAAQCHQHADVPQGTASPQLSTMDAVVQGDPPHLAMPGTSAYLRGGGRRTLSGACFAYGLALALQAPPPMWVSAHRSLQRSSDRPDAAYTTIPPPLCG